MVPVTGYMAWVHIEHDSGVFSAQDPALLREADSRAPGAFLTPSWGMERTMIKVDKEFSEGGDRIA